MSNYVDTIQLEGGTDYPIKVPNGVTYRNPSAMTPSQNPLLRRNDLVQTLSNDEDNPPSSKAVKTVTDGLSSQLTYSSDTNGRVSYGRIGRIVFVSVYNALSSTDFTFLPTPVAYTSLVFWSGSGTYKGYVEYSSSWVNHITVDGAYGSFCYIAAS